MHSIVIPDSVRTILEVIYSSSNVEAYVVGGCVRDFLLGIEPNDWDICTSADPYTVKDILGRYGIQTYDTGIKHGTVTAHMPDMDIEITTFRIDKGYSDHRKPDSVEFTDDIVLDLARRDFTINAIACDKNGNFVDPFNGIDDIKSGVVRCVGSPDDRFGEDYLRVLRAIRFGITKNMTIDDATSDSIRRNIHLVVGNISPERINKELCKILSTEYNHTLAKYLTEYTDVFCTIIPEIVSCVDFNQNNPYHKFTVWDHIIHTVEAAPSDLYLRLSALFHDIGKPRCYTCNNDGIGHFYGHPKVSEDMARSIMSRLRFSNNDIDEVCYLVGSHDCLNTNYNIPKSSLKRLLKSSPSTESVFRLLDLKKADIIGQGFNSEERISYIELAKKMLQDIIDSEQCFKLKDLAINGYDMMDIGFKGRDIGLNLNSILDKVILGLVENNRDDLIRFARSQYLAQKGEANECRT